MGTVLAGVIVIGVVTLAGMSYRWIMRKAHAKKILQFMKSTTNYKYRSAKAIASACHLTEARVDDVCSHDTRFRRSVGNKSDMWLIEGESEPRGFFG